MKVSRGFSEEIKSCVWAKADVELDEGDLARILIAAEVPADQWTHLTVGQAYAILSQEAEVLCYREYMKSLTSAKLLVSEGVRQHFISLNRTVGETIADCKALLASKASEQ
jgi:hypothetical protein